MNLMRERFDAREIIVVVTTNGAELRGRV
jgi:hypothetical protein